MRAVLYTRVSSDQTGQARSVEDQERECREYCARQGWEVVRVFTDNDRSASRYARKDRPEFARLREFIAERQADVLVLWEGSRATRDLTDFAALRELCSVSGVQYAYSGRLYDLSRTDDRFTTGLDALLSEREASMTRDRVLRGKRIAAVEGRPVGKLPYGYTRRYELINGKPKLVEQSEHEEQAAVVREAARRVIAGESCYSIANDLNGRGIPAPRGGTWDITQIRRIASSPLYVSKRIHQGRIVGDGTWPPILDDETWAMACGILSDPARRTHRDHSVKWLLSGIAQCGLCEAGLYTIKNRGNRTYTCMTCFKIGLKVQTLDDFLTEVILERLRRDDMAALIADVNDAGREQVLETQSRARELRDRLDEFYEAAGRGEVSPTGLASIEAKLLPQIEAAEQAAQGVAVPVALRGLAGTSPTERWADLDIVRQRQVVRALMIVHVDPIGRGRRIFDPARVRIDWKV